MNILMLGLGKGSFIVRGEQLGAALKALVRTAPGHEDLVWADVVVLIKQAGPLWADAVRAAGKPIVWDALDYWRQPEDNGWQADEALASLQRLIKRIRPAVTIGATRAMAEACGGVYLPHHARPGLVVTPVRDVVSVVAYEGKRKYLGRWGQAVAQECARRGWQFFINPPDLGMADVLVSGRDGAWDGWICQAWKSGVKLVNAIAAGRPMLAQASAAWDEIQPVGTVMASPDEVPAAFEQWSSLHMRQRAAGQAETRRQFTLAQVAQDYRTILERAA